MLRAEHCGAGLGPLLPFSETGIVGPCRGRSGGEVPIAEPAPRNRFLAVLGADDLRRLAPDLVRAPAQRGTVLLETERETRFVWFPESCVISLVTTTREGETAETATVGREGVAGLFAALGDGRSIATGVVQVPGEVWRLPVASLRAAFEASPGVRRLCLRHSQALAAHILRAAACAALHTAEARLCRWLLQIQDQVEGEATLPLTHAFLAEMLGLERTTVTLAARALHRAGLIAYRRGQVTVLDRAGLEEASCECYAAIRAHYERLLPQVAEGDVP